MTTETERRRDLRAATLFLIDDYRQSVGCWPGLAGSVDLGDALGHFEEGLTLGPLGSEVGGALRSSVELPFWQELLRALEPVWKLYGDVVWGASAYAEFVASNEWSRAVECAQRCVDALGLWDEEVSWPVRYKSQGQVRQIEDAATLRSADRADLAGRQFLDACNRPVVLSLELEQIAVKWVGLPLAITA